MSEKIIGIGLSRTGTTSLDHFLKKLGYDSHHYIPTLFGEPDWKTLEECDAVMDSPIPLMYQEIDQRFPNSKFILTTRNEDDWLTSMKWMLTHGKVIWNYSSELQDYHIKLYECFSYKEKILRRRFREYHKEIEAYFADRKDDLHVINISEGFDTKALCQWLGKEPIDAPEPKVNARRTAPKIKRLKYWVKETLGILHHGI